MSGIIKTTGKIVLKGVGVVIAVAIAAAGYLVYPGTPSNASSLTFKGFVPLPSAGWWRLFRAHGP